ncbi:MAG: hypothetical protein DRN28_00550 [Thermoplasmata archaeon]|nr:MAG: hypothetical protein DRN28_00550 [Thermoplasmata archaeon]
MYLTGNLKRRPLRTVTIILTIALAISINISLSSLSSGLSYSARELIEDVGMDLIVLPRGTAPLLMELTTMDWGHRMWEEIMEIEHVEAAAPRYLSYLFVRCSDGNFTEVPVYGIMPEMEMKFTQFRIKEGFYFTSGNDSGEVRDGALLSSALLKKTGLGVGDAVVFHIPTPEGGWREFSFQITGEYTDALNEDGKEALISLTTLQVITGVREKDTISEILIKLTDERWEEDVREYLTQQFTYRDSITVYSEEEIYEEVQRIVDILDNFSLIIYLLTTTISLIIFSTIFIINLLERREELGVLNILGIPRRAIASGVLAEGILYSMAGFVLALVLSNAFMRGFSSIVQKYYWKLPEGATLFYSSLPATLYFFLLCIAIALVSTLPGALYYLKKTPVELIRGESV